MRMYQLTAAVILAATVAGCSQSEKPAKELQLDTQEKKLSYIFGQNIGGQFKAESVDLDINAFSEGVKDALSDAEPRMKQEDVLAVLETFQQNQAAEREARQAELADKNKAEGDTFLAENAKKAGVVTLDSGLQYKIVEEGTGPSPTADDVVEVHYTGKLIDGTVFDSSVKRGVPATFGVNQVIPGWTEALQLMKEGAKWELYIPPSLAYGPGGTGGPIGPNQTLIFDVELLKASAGDAEEIPAEDAAETDK